jgi:hypothetical protein
VGRREEETSIAEFIGIFCNFSGHDESFKKTLLNRAVIPECVYRESILNLVFHRKANGFPLSRE